MASCIEWWNTVMTRTGFRNMCATEFRNRVILNDIFTTGSKMFEPHVIWSAYFINTASCFCKLVAVEGTISQLSIANVSSMSRVLLWYRAVWYRWKKYIRQNNTVARGRSHWQYIANATDVKIRITALSLMKFFLSYPPSPSLSPPPQVVQRRWDTDGKTMQ